MAKKNAPGPKAEGVVCLHSPADTDAYSTAAARCQYFQRLGIPFHRVDLIAGLCFGEAASCL